MPLRSTPKDDAEPPGLPETCDEERTLRRHRYRQARAVGLSIAEAELFADSNADIGVLRQLAAAGCPADLIAAIVI